MGGKRPTRFEPRIIDGTTWAVWDLLFKKWYEPHKAQLICSIDLEEIEKHCANLQRQFEFANPLPFLDENESGPDFMDPDYAFKNVHIEVERQKMDETDRKRFVHSIDYALRYLHQEAKCYCYTDELEYKELISMINDYRSKICSDY